MLYRAKRQAIGISNDKAIGLDAENVQNDNMMIGAKTTVSTTIAPSRGQNPAYLMLLSNVELCGAPRHVA
jgi:hypothetical protein